MPCFHRVSAAVGACLLLANHSALAQAQEAVDPGLDSLIAAAETPAAAIAQAQAQEAAGDQIGAASTLERALIASPGADRVRIEYVRILCRLNDRDSAHSELALMRGRPASSQAWQQMIAACGADFSRAQRRTSEVDARLVAGLAYDSNAREQLTSYEVFGGGGDDGLALVAAADVEARIPAGSGFVYGNAFALSHNDLSGPRNDYQFGQLAVGFGKEFDRVAVSAGPVIRHGRLFGENHLTAYGGQARLALRAGRSGQAIVAAQVVHEDYADDDYNGAHLDLLAGYDATSVTRRRWFVGLGAELKDARFGYLDYRAYRLAASHERPLGEAGTYLAASLSLRRIVFADDGGQEGRKEWRLFSRLALGIPIVGQRLFVEPAATFRLREYGSAGFAKDYRSFGGELRLVWRL